ncbi:lipoyl(octanoyl) transferase LipB [Nakamurella lactea]|uniref:lipoyl(octanoyl) transferase LipB n=1 Tax=Nakamurella lactea TaxID=459515 RepID=UPI00040008C4|nr:lipoyl(octanoyl) transferase LipB [Nakamurella lactea]
MLASGSEPTFIEAGRVDYLTAWERQRELAAARVAGTGRDTVLLLEHDHVYTAGKRTQPQDRPTDGSPVIDVDRGGRITWHGPGQLVGYPVVALAEPVDVVAYVRMLEQVLIEVCAQLGLATGRIGGRSGVWLPAGSGLPERKIAAIGVRIARGVAMHGFALNCNPDLTAFDRIVPCGIADAGVTSLTRELGRAVTIQQALPLVRAELARGLMGTLPITDGLIGRPATAAGIDWQLDPALR